MGRSVVIVTGGTRGIGEATTRRLAAAGYLVCATYREDEASARHLEQSTPENVRVGRFDVSHEAAVDDMVRWASRMGPVVGLVNNVGVAEEQSDLVDMSLQRWQRVFTTNVFSTFLCCRAVIPLMSTRSGGQGGAIVTVSSRASELGSPHEYIDYAASKGAIDSLTRGLAKEVAELGIRVNAVRPGVIDTEFHALGGEPGRAHRVGPHCPLGRAGRPDEVAAAIAWLISDEASYTTGAVLDVAGGR